MFNGSFKKNENPTICTCIHMECHVLHAKLGLSTTSKTYVDISHGKLQSLFDMYVGLVPRMVKCECWAFLKGLWDVFPHDQM